MTTIMNDTNAPKYKKALRSFPPVGMCRIVNIYYDPVTQKVVFEWDTAPMEEVYLP
jgi:hypothetical protein